MTSYDNNSTHLCYMDQAKPPTSNNNNKKRKRQQLRGMPSPLFSSPPPALACLVLPVTLLLRPRQLRLGIVYVFVSASLPAAVTLPVAVSVAALPLAALCLPRSAVKWDIFARLISGRTCGSSSRCVFRFQQHILRQKVSLFVSA